MNDTPLWSTMPWARLSEDPEHLLTREWLVTNGRGGYASGSVSGACTRRHHGLLIAALPAPLGRMVMLTHLGEEVRVPGGEVYPLGAAELSKGNLEMHSARVLGEFRLEAGLPTWRYDFDGVIIEKSLMLPHHQNTVQVTYRLVEAPGPIRLRMRPSMFFRKHNERVDVEPDTAYTIVARGDRFEIHGPEGVPPLRMLTWGRSRAWVLDGGHYRDYFYRVEASRGYDAEGPLWSPGYLRADLEVGEAVTLVATTEDWDVAASFSPPKAREVELQRRHGLLFQADPRAQDQVASELVLAADQFIITPTARVADASRAMASGHEVRTVIAGYHWFTDWGRDTMISLEGLTLVTGRHAEAGWILRTFGHYVRDGLLPNLFPEGDNEGLYHTADATLWFFHAIERYLRYTGDRSVLHTLMPTLRDIVDHHLKGTHFNIRIDPADGLMTQGAEGYQLTWMDAKVDDWVVTPRRGKAVELNALWYNALRLLEGWYRDEGLDDDATEMAAHAERARAAFNERFWYDEGGYLYDIVDGEGGDDPALRPNQVFAIALDHPVLDQARWAPVMEVVRRELLTPVGLRSLSRQHPDYKDRYFGDLRARDAAYHQGTVWGWLIGPYVDAWLKVHPDDHEGARKLLDGFREHLTEACLGSISEVFDAEAPFTPRGCIAQAWSIAETLRCWVKTSGIPQVQRNRPEGRKVAKAGGGE